jgi:hypothetical protein
MKKLWIMIALALLTLLPVFFFGLRHRDVSVGSSLYVKSINYDSEKKLNDESEIEWRLECDDDCLLEFILSPSPDNDTVWLRFGRLTGADSFYDHAMANSQGVWALIISNPGKGWFTARADYTFSGVPVTAEKSFYLR